MGDWLSSLGSVVGIGVGKIDILLLKQEYAPGETIHGRLVMKVKEPIEAKRLVVLVEATCERTRLESDGRGGRRQVTSTVTVHKVERELDGKRTYRDDAFDFHLPLPGSDTKVEMPNGFLGDVAKFINVVSSLQRSPLRWRVHAFLDIPWKANLKAAADIVVR
jgi:sporulation-control protein spo0M